MSLSTDNDYMNLALRLAAQGELTCAPNPQVGCIIVRKGQIVGQGYHHQAGTPHAEVHALREAGEKAEGADVYVTLEPCSHTGRTPPCVDALIAAKVARVIIPFADPNPLVAGLGIHKLMAAGISVTVDIASTEAAWQNRLFLTLKQYHRPYVIAKWAMTTRGELTHPSKRWISNPKARQHTHLWRQRVDAILVGKQTALIDNPALTNRTETLPLEQLHQPLRIVLSHALSIPDSCSPDGKPLKLSHPGLPGETWWISPGDASQAVSQPFRAGITQWQLPKADGHVSLPALLAFLATQGIASLLVEGGPHTLNAFLLAGLVDEAHVYIDAPNLDDVPKADGRFWQALQSFKRINDITLGDNTWLQFAKPSDLASQLTTKTHALLRSIKHV